MSRTQWVTIAIAAINMALLLMFPPYDYLSIQRGNVATFDGFYFAIGSHHNRIINANFLTLELIVVLINSAIAWLLFRPSPILAHSRIGGNRNQRIVLAAVGVNLVVMLLFPPFENFTAITKATLPTFDGFYFIFGDNTQRQIVTPILYLELALTLINGGLLWLLLKDRSQNELSAQQIREMAHRIQQPQKA